MDLRRSKQAQKPKVSWEERAASSTASDTKFIKKTAKMKQKTAPKPPIIGPVSEPIKIDDNAIPEHLQRIELPVIVWEQKGAPPPPPMPQPLYTHR